MLLSDEQVEAYAMDSTCRGKLYKESRDITSVDGAERFCFVKQLGAMIMWTQMRVWLGIIHNYARKVQDVEPL